MKASAAGIETLGCLRLDCPKAAGGKVLLTIFWRVVARGPINPDDIMLSALQLFRLVSIPAAMVLFVFAAQMSAGLTTRTEFPAVVTVH
jgi:hypothetical protein